MPAAAEDDLFLRDFWYFALAGRKLAKGALKHVTLLEEPIVLGRGSDGAVFALRDICPHRGIPLSGGRVEGRQVECPYHGWRFDGASGRCTAIPSLVEGQDFDVGRIGVKSYPCREVQGNIWVYVGDRSPEENIHAPAPPELPDIGGRTPKHVESMNFPCDIDHAVVGLMDPAHGPFVHRSWWWRSRKSIHEKAKAFGPSPLGFTMLRHKPSSNSAAYKLLGGEATTEIAFRLPGIRVEHMRFGANAVVGLTAVTPVNRTETVVNHAIYWTARRLDILKPVLPMFARTFLGQDRDIVAQQAEGLAHDPSLMLINDADQQAKWYYRLKREWRRAATDRRDFENPVQGRTLHWRS